MIMMYVGARSLVDTNECHPAAPGPPRCSDWSTSEAGAAAYGQGSQCKLLLVQAVKSQICMTLKIRRLRWNQNLSPFIEDMLLSNTFWTSSKQTAPHIASPSPLPECSTAQHTVNESSKLDTTKGARHICGVFRRTKTYTLARCIVPSHCNDTIPF